MLVGNIDITASLAKLRHGFVSAIRGCNVDCGFTKDAFNGVDLGTCHSVVLFTDLAFSLISVTVSHI